MDTLSEYVRDSKIVENGEVCIRPGLSEIEQLEHPDVGTLEAFISDGCRTLVKTLKAKNIKEKTLRYKGHIEIMEIFKMTGLLNE